MPYPGDFVYASSVFGKPGDKTTMDLPPFNAMKDSSITFNVYHYGKSYLHVTADIKLSNGGHSVQVNYVSYFSVGWNKVCLDLEEGEASGVSFTTLRSQEPFSLVAVDDILYNEQPCPGKQTVCPYFLSTRVLLIVNNQYWHHFKGTYIFWDICVLVVSVNCTFDEDLCGYTADSDWSLERRANSSTSKSFQIKYNKSFGNIIPLIGKSNQIHVPFATYSLPTKIIWRWAVWIFDYCHVPVTCQVCFFKKLMSCLLINYFSNLICCLHRWILCNGPKSNVLLNCHLGFGVSTCHWGRKLIMRAAGDDEVYIRSWCFQNNVRLFWGEEMWRCTVFDIFGSDL